MPHLEVLRNSMEPCTFSHLSCILNPLVPWKICRSSVFSRASKWPVLEVQIKRSFFLFFMLKWTFSKNTVAFTFTSCWYIHFSFAFWTKKPEKEGPAAVRAEKGQADRTERPFERQWPDLCSSKKLRGEHKNFILFPLQQRRLFPMLDIIPKAVMPFEKTSSLGPGQTVSWQMWHNLEKEGDNSRETS